MGDLHEVIAACADFDHVLKTFVERVKTPGDAVEHARKLQEGVGLFQFLLEEESRIRKASPAPSRPDGLVAGIFPNTLEVQQLLQELDTVNGTIRALDEMIAAENIPLADGIGASSSVASSGMISAEALAACNTLPGQIPSSATLPGQPVIGGLQLLAASAAHEVCVNSGLGWSNALVAMDAPSSRRLADAQDTAHVASLLCSPRSPDSPPAPPPLPRPDSQELFPVVPIEAIESEPPAAEGAVQSEGRPRQPVVVDLVPLWNGAPEEVGLGVLPPPQLPQPELHALVPMDDAIESFSEDVVLKSLELPDALDPPDLIQATWEPLEPLKNELQHLPALQNALDHPPRPGQHLQASRPSEQAGALVAVESNMTSHDLAFYRNVIDVTDDPLGPNRPPASAEATALVPVTSNAPSHAPSAPDGRAAPLRRRRPALLSQVVRRLGPRSQTASQRLGRSLARSRRSRPVTGGWILSQRKSQGGQAKHVKHTEEREVTVERMQESGAVGAASCPERPNVLFTGFSRSDLHRLKQSVNCLGGSAVRDLPAGRTAAETRVVVRCTTSTCGLQIAGARTIKYLDAVLAGAWVLSPEWVYASMRAGHWLEEADFELQGDTAKMGGPPQGRRHGPELFAGLRFHFVSQAEGPAPHQLARLARRAGAEVLETLRKVSDAKEDPPHLAQELASTRKRKRSANSAGKESSSLPHLWWRKPIMVTVPSKGRGLDRTAKLADELGWVTLPSTWMLDCISGGEVCSPQGCRLTSSRQFEE
ncbi:unnamed protein product [Durusdinium trenchii]|uniref:BRCT domain-containing protein n=1 Tax=Durusdinium trenchii TaxID=1381693 RepID=A0ABP0I1Q8_9DINO